jgi:NAD(P)H-hydrate epimerase
MSPVHPRSTTFGRLLVPAPTGDEAASFDRRAIEGLGVPQAVLMENAGRTAAQIIQRLAPEGPIVGVVGAGNNGGDALVLLRTLAAWGREVLAVRVADRHGPETVLHGWSIPTVADGELDGDAAWDGLLGSAAVVVDGILGTGVKGAPRERQAAAIRRINEARRPVVALDVPSGVDAGTGAVPGAAVQARLTVCFGAPKLGALLHPGRALAGRVVAVEIGFPPMGTDAAGAQVATPAWARDRLPKRPSDTHKNAVGRLLVVAGRPGMAGAAVLAVRAALRAGAGLVQVASPPANRAILQATVPEAIYLDPSDGAALDQALADAGAVAVGPGLGTDADAEAILARVLASSAAPLVVDADALNLLAAGRPAALPESLRGRRVLLTPHPGEMARLRHALPVLSAAGAASSVEESRAAAGALGCVVLLKGAPSVVAAPGEPVLVDVQGSSDLAVAGMGDVLTGMCGSLLAQGCSLRDAGALGLHLTGRAAALAGRGKSLVPTDVIRWLPEALAEERDGASDLAVPGIVLDLEAAR